MTFAARKKRPLNRVFDAIGFFYPDYPDLTQESKKRRKKMTTKRSKVPMVRHGATPSQASGGGPYRYDECLNYVILT